MDHHDQRVRQKAFEFLIQLTDQFGDALPYDRLTEGFYYEDARVPLLAPQGIFKPRILELPLTIATAPNGPYNDSFTDDGLLRYRYRGTNPQHRDNVGLRETMRQRKPLIYLHGLVPGKYLGAWPVYVVEDDPQQLTFTVAVDDRVSFGREDELADVKVDIEDDVRRRYVTTETRARLHQRTFRERVIKAYHEQCAMCRLRHQELLDAAHIIPDKDEFGEPSVNNGISLCKIHHAAFDRGIVGIRPDYVVEVRLDVLEETDGPMLKYGLQEMHGTQLWIPKAPALQPSKVNLQSRYETFLASPP